MAQGHDLGVRKRKLNERSNPRALTKEMRRAKYKNERMLAAYDLRDKTGRWPKGWDPNDTLFMRRLFTWEVK